MEEPAEEKAEEEPAPEGEKKADDDPFAYKPDYSSLAKQSFADMGTQAGAWVPGIRGARFSAPDECAGLLRHP